MTIRAALEVEISLAVAKVAKKFESATELSFVDALSDVLNMEVEGAKRLREFVRMAADREMCNWALAHGISPGKSDGGSPHHGDEDSRSECKDAEPISIDERWEERTGESGGGYDKWGKDTSH
jgi:hypothetical protein